LIKSQAGGIPRWRTIQKLDLIEIIGGERLLCSANIRSGSLGWRATARWGSIWHDAGMLHLTRAIVEVLSDLVKLAVLFLRPASAIRAENLALRRQLAAYIERGIKPKRLDHAGHVSLAVLSRLFSWREAIV
jgi:hypothetical protein